jgi:DNA-binding transcriptional regulator YbjK
VEGRRERILDAAIELLGERGVRAVTHRAVDTAADLPPGSTSNHFRTSDALLEAVVERFAARERTNADEIASGVAPTTPDELVRVLTDVVLDMTGPRRTLTLARYALLVEGAQRPALQSRLEQTGARVNAWAAIWLRTAGSERPELHAPILGNYLTGLVLHQLAIPDPSFDPADRIRAAVYALLAPKEEEWTKKPSGVSSTGSA